MSYNFYNLEFYNLSELHCCVEQYWLTCDNGKLVFKVISDSVDSDNL